MIQESLCVGMMSENKKCCSDCKTTKTPLWRGGPAGPKVIFPSNTHDFHVFSFFFSSNDIFVWVSYLS
jgi:hypothetical protein